MTTPPPQAQPQPTSTNAIISLVLGIIGILLCGGILSPVAWFLGNRAESEIDASGGALGGRGMATAGKILGIIGTVLLVLWLVITIVTLIVGGSFLFVHKSN